MVRLPPPPPSFRGRQAGTPVEGEVIVDAAFALVDLGAEEVALAEETEAGIDPNSATL
jgi:hypothetical protein